MLKRIATGACLILLGLIPSFLWMDTPFLPILVSLFCGIGVYELFRCIGHGKDYPLLVPAVLIGLAAPIAARYFVSREGFYSAAFVAIVVTMFFTLAMGVFNPERAPCKETSLPYLLSVYVIIGFSSVIFVSNLADAKLLYPMIFLGAFVTDIFAYFTGMLFGRHKLIPRISPKKTVEGAIGGTVCCVLAFLLYGYLVARFGGRVAHYGALAATGLVLSLISQLGDLIASAVKRCFGVKDFGTIFPGHGGIMDRFDSLIAVAGFLAIISAHLQIRLFS